MTRLRAVTFRLPHSEASATFLTALRTLLGGVPYAAAAPGRLQLTPPAPTGALPVTVFELADVAAPQLLCGDAWSLTVDAEATRSRSSTAGASTASARGAGTAPPPLDGPDALVPGVDLAEAAALLAGHVVAVDHTGVNLPAATLPLDRWQVIVAALAEASTFYRYPTGEPWLFVLPSTAAEHADDIRDFPDGREPRFEVVRDEWLDAPLWQFALHTDLSRPQLEALFPAPAGTAFPGLGDVFRAVTVRSPWPGLLLRLDLYYRSGLRTDWETGEWLVAEGGRIIGSPGVRNNDPT